MNPITLLQPKRISFGNDCALQAVTDIIAAGHRRVFVVSSLPLMNLAQPILDALANEGASVEVFSDIPAEPTIGMFEEAREAAADMKPDVVLGIGGGSPLDVAKVVAALHNKAINVREVFGINILSSRETALICLPTTAGTGSEVSPNALLLDEGDLSKKAVVSPHLVPDAAYVDPRLTVTMPPAVTAGTGLDALTHSVEAFTNRFSHPMVDLYAIQSIRLAGASLIPAIRNGEDLEARAGMALASLYGGLCLGPVNTAAVHALAYPLGGEFHVPHGLSNAVLLPHVMEFNLPSAPEKHAEIALALGAGQGASLQETGLRGVAKVKELVLASGAQSRISDFGIPETAIPEMASSAMKVTRLLKNNPREVTYEDAVAIYRSAF
jgi:alcohol dehydrogenase class IV